jgi:hypothetical protein
MTNPRATPRWARWYGPRVTPAITILACIAAWCPPFAAASDPPHWSSSTVSTDCTTPCHVVHHAAGAGLTSSAGNVNLCQSCHNPSGAAGDLPINSSDAAVAGVQGTSHAFNVAAVNGPLGTQEPVTPAMQLRVMGGNVVCSTCHNQHSSNATFGGRPRVSPAKQTTALGSTGSLTSGGLFNGSTGVWFLVEIVTGGNQGTARFRYSKDNGTSWFPTPPATLGAGTGVTLDSGVTVSFAPGNFAVGERWEFSASWPFLRAAVDSGANGQGDTYCRDCHRSWVMDHESVRTYDGNFKSHPVGVALNTNGMGYDRPVPLDGNGAPQGGTGVDGNPTNDLLLDSAGLVQCLTCHGVHYVDSNTLSVDGP